MMLMMIGSHISLAHQSQTPRIGIMLQLIIIKLNTYHPYLRIHLVGGQVDKLQRSLLDPPTQRRLFGCSHCGMRLLITIIIIESQTHAVVGKYPGQRLLLLCS